MSTDTATLGSITLDGWAAPQAMVGGGKHAMAVHKLPGGSRVVDTLGPDNADIPISGQFYSSDAYSKCLAIDAMRVSGNTVSLIWGGQYLSVIIADFHYTVHRYPNLCDYSIICLVVSNPMQGLISSIVSTVGSMIASDLSAMSSF